MPRIAAAVGVFATIAICIFINIKRYPAVWDMVGSSSWFTQAENAASEDPAAQAVEVAENETPEKPLPTPQPEPQTHVYKPLPSLRPQLASEANAVGDAPQDAAAGQAVAESRPQQTPVYQGLNPGPIKVSDPTGESWPAEMSPRMKYAAKPPLLESYQQWNTERPVVPVIRVEKEENKDDEAPKNNTEPSLNDSSQIDRAKQNDMLAAEDNEEIAEHLPAVDPNLRPIRMSIQGSYPDQAIPFTRAPGFDGVSLKL